MITLYKLTLFSLINHLKILAHRIPLLSLKTKGNKNLIFIILSENVRIILF